MKLNTWTRKMRVTDIKVFISYQNQGTSLNSLEESFNHREKLKKKSFSLSNLFHKSSKKKALGSFSSSNAVNREFYQKSPITLSQKARCKDRNQNNLTEKKLLESKSRDRLSQLSLEAVIKEAESELCSEKRTEAQGFLNMNHIKIEEHHSNSSSNENDNEEVYEIMEFKKVFSGNDMDDYMTMDFV